MKLPRLQSVAEELFLRSSWVVFFIFICLMVYENNLKHYRHDFHKLQSKAANLQKEKNEAEVLNESLKLKVSSQNDPDWVSLVLMEELGIVPEGETKIIFKRVADY